MGGELPVTQDPFRVDRELTLLQSEYTDFTFGRAPAPFAAEPRFEAVRTSGDGTLWALITSDADEMRRILDRAALG